MAQDKTQGKPTGAPAASTSGAAAATTGEKAKRERSTPAQARKNLVARVKESVSKAVVSLQASEMKRTGTLTGNAELVKAYEAFVAELDKLATIPEKAPEVAPAA